MGGVPQFFVSTECFGISVQDPQRDWLALATKISSGKSVEQAASEAGIPMEEVFEHARTSMGLGEAAQWQFMLIAQRAVCVGLTKLEEIANAGPREEQSAGGVDEETGAICMPTKLHNTDLEAAKALAKLGIDAAKLSAGLLAQRERSKAAGSKLASIQVDLFDIAPNPWDLRETESH